MVRGFLRDDESSVDDGASGVGTTIEGTVAAILLARPIDVLSGIGATAARENLEFINLLFNILDNYVIIEKA